MKRVLGLTVQPGTALLAGMNEVHAGPPSPGPRMFAFAIGIPAEKNEEEDGGVGGDDDDDGGGGTRRGAASAAAAAGTTRTTESCSFLPSYCTSISAAYCSL